jgi:sortase (surface protein transpeptidase)
MKRPTLRKSLILVVGLLLLALGVSLIIVGMRGPAKGPSIPGPIGQASGAVSAPATLLSMTAKKASTTAYEARSVPVHITIPAIGVSASLVQLGRTSSGDVAVPKSWNTPGWYKYGPSPGQKGSAAILGHVDSTSGPAIFYNLSKLRPGDKVSVKLADGNTVEFSVIGLRTYSKDKFPSKVVYGGRPYSALQLITCTGVFDSSTHHYLSNLVVFTKRVVKPVKTAALAA